MFASSQGPTPLELEEDEIIINFHSIGDEPATLIFPDIMTFSERPTLKSAKALLRAYKIHLPLSTRLPSKHHKTKSTTTIPSKKGGGNPVVYELLILDTMHDLLNTDPVAIYDIFKKEIDLSPLLKRSFLESSYSFTRDAAYYILAKANIVMKTSYFETKTKQAYDFALVAAISNWTNMKFVLDNFVVNLTKGCGKESHGTLVLIGCAYLIVLCANMKRLNMLVGQTIVFIDGFFMKMDGNYMSRFLTLFCKTIRRLTNMDTNIQAYKIISQITRPKYFNQLFPEANVIIDNTHITFKNTKYGIVSFGQHQAANITFPHTKTEFFKHVKQHPKNKDLWHLIFLRDAFKADVAVETGSIFITHDRLAHTYYKLIGGNHGLLVALEQDGEKDNYSVMF
jgi:hypothetical protein